MREAVGLNTVISKALGKKDTEEVRRAADAAIFIAFCSWVVIAVLCLLLVKRYFAWQSGGDEVIAKYGIQYLAVCMLFSLGQMGQWVFDRFVIASGRSGLFLFTLSAASITNLILDPIFIFELFCVFSRLGNEQHDPYNGEAGGPAASFCRIARQVGKCESAVDGIYFCGIFGDPIGGLVLEERLRADTGRDA